MTRADSDNPPVWLHCKKSLVPDMIAADPQKMPVWEITGAEFSRSEHHTADGISIRFPRITKQRDDKTHREATSLADLNRLFEASKEGANLQMITDGLDSNDEADDAIEIKTKIQGAHVSPSNKRNGQALAAEVVDQKKTKIEANAIQSETSKEDIIEQEPIEDISPISKRKIKIDYKFADSSDEDDGMGEVTSVALKILVDKQEDISKIEKILKTEPSESVSNALSKTRSSAKKSESTTTAKDNEVGHKQTAAGNSSINIFESVVLFVPSELRDRVREELRYFKIWGGQEARTQNKCSHVLHAEPYVTEEWSVVR